MNSTGTGKAKRGRPRGSKSADRQIVLVRPAVCPGCGSTDRTPYKMAFVREVPGTIGEARYSRIVYRDCQCLNCGRPRREAHFEAPAKPAKAA